MGEDSQSNYLSYNRGGYSRTGWSESPEERRWRYRRVFFRGSLFLLIFVPIACYIGPNMINFGKPTGLSTADFAAKVDLESRSIVGAMKEYQRDNGHLPDRMENLVPRYLAVPPSGMKGVSNGEFWQFTEFNHLIHYDFTPGAEHWSVSGPLVTGILPLPPVPMPTTQSVISTSK